MGRIAQVPGIIEIDHNWSPSEKCKLQDSRKPGQCFLFNPDQVVSLRTCDLAQSAPVGSDKNLRTARFAAKQPLDVFVIQEWRTRHTETSLFERRQIVVVAHPTARSLPRIS